MLHGEASVTDINTEPQLENDLIRRAQAHDARAFCALAERHSRRIYLLAFHYCHSAQDAEDLSQEVWLKAYQAIHTFRFDSSFYTWLRRITVNTFLNYRRSNSIRRHGQTTVVQMLTIDSKDLEELSEHTASEESIYNKVLFDSVISALSELTPSQRLVFLLRHYEGMAYEEIANAMSCSTGTVKKSVWRALGKLRAKLDARDTAADEVVAQLATEY